MSLLEEHENLTLNHPEKNTYKSYQNLNNIGYPEFHFNECNLKLSKKEIKRLKHIENVINYTLRYKTESELNDINNTWIYRKYLSSRVMETKPIEISINLSLPYDYMVDYKLSHNLEIILNYAGIDYFNRSYMCGMCNYTIIKFDRLLKTQIETYIKTYIKNKISS